MTVDDLLKTMAHLWPRHCSSQWVVAWGPQFSKVLGHHAGERLRKAWDQTMATWQWSRPPQPADILKHTGESSQDQKKEKPLPFGREHFDICKRLSAQLYTRWHDAHRQWLEDGEPVANAAKMECRVRAREQAAQIVFAGHRELPAEASLQWTEADWTSMQARARSRLKATAATTGSGLKPLHVSGLFRAGKRDAA